MSGESGKLVTICLCGCTPPSTGPPPHICTHTTYRAVRNKEIARIVALSRSTARETRRSLPEKSPNESQDVFVWGAWGGAHRGRGRSEESLCVCTCTHHALVTEFSVLRCFLTAIFPKHKSSKSVSVLRNYSAFRGIWRSVSQSKCRNMKTTQTLRAMILGTFT